MPLRSCFAWFTSPAILKSVPFDEDSLAGSTGLIVPPCAVADLIFGIPSHTDQGLYLACRNSRITVLLRWFSCECSGSPITGPIMVSNAPELNFFGLTCARRASVSAVPGLRYRVRGSAKDLRRGNLGRHVDGIRDMVIAPESDRPLRPL